VKHEYKTKDDKMFDSIATIHFNKVIFIAFYLS